MGKAALPLPPMIAGLNHLTLAVRDLDRSLAFYRDRLGLAVVRHVPGSAYLTAGELWLCLHQDPAATPAGGDTHIALSVTAADFDTLVASLRPHVIEWHRNSSEGSSFYFIDPDGHRLELHVGGLASRLAYFARE